MFTASDVIKLIFAASDVSSNSSHYTVIIKRQVLYIIKLNTDLSISYEYHAYDGFQLRPPPLARPIHCSDRCQSPNRLQASCKPNACATVYTVVTLQ